jgi:hypothetical protein
MSLRLPVLLAALTALATVADPPVVVRATERRFAAEAASDGAITRGDLQRVRVEHRDEGGRLIRWERRDADGELEMTWAGVYFADGRAVDRAVYWNADGLVPYPELYVTSKDGIVQDVLYGDPGEKPRRQIRQYLDADGRELFQEYFAPRSQRKYSEEVYAYDEMGNETGRTWRRLDGRAQRVTRFEIVERNQYGHWTLRRVHVNDSLTAIDEREIVYGTATRPHPPAAAGPVTPRPEILPIPLAPGVVSSREAGENTLTFGPAGATALFTRYGDDWTKQRGYLAAWRDGSWREPEAVPFAEAVYNAALSEDGRRVIFCQHRDGDEGPRVLVTRRTGDGWAEPIDLTARGGFTGSYFRLLTDGTLYFHRDGDLYRAVLDDGAVRDETPLGAPINTADGTEFGAWVDYGEQRIIFARGTEPPGRSGVYTSIRRAGRWTEPERLPIPYGWGIVISPDGEDLVYTVDGDIVRVPLVLLPSLGSP